ncbi:MAG: sigma-70 family RNA polymerase sigma factor, partial [Anaerolineae bacterium]
FIPMAGGLKTSRLPPEFRQRQPRRPLLESNHVVQDELLLLSRARSLDAEALAEIHDTFYVPIFRYIAFRVSEHELAEDLTSEVFTRLLSALRDRAAPQKTLRGWLFGVASRIVKDHYRKQYRRPQTALDDSIPSTVIGPEQAIDIKLTQENLHQAMATLTEEQQNVVALRFGQGLSIRDAAQAMSKSEGSIKMLQARAIKALSKQLAGR